MIKEAEAERKKQNAAGSGAAAGTMMPEPAEDTDRIGNLLCHERLKKGLELEDISQVLCIRRVYLEAIESGNYVELPPLPYSAGFVNSYAKYLGLNNTRITQLFREELNDGAREKRIFMTEDLSAEAGLPDKRYIIGGIAALFLIGGLWSLWHRSGDENAPTERIVSETAADAAAGEIEYFSPSTDEAEAVQSGAVPETIAQPAEQEAEAAVEERPVEQVVMKEESFIEPQVRHVAEEAAGSAAENAAAETVKPAAAEMQTEKAAASVEIKISKEDTWIEVRDNKKVYFNKVMRPGESYRVPEGKGMILSAGKYNGVEVYINGRLTPVIQPNKKMNIALDPFVEAAEH